MPIQVSFRPQGEILMSTDYLPRFLVVAILEMTPEQLPLIFI